MRLLSILCAIICVVTSNNLFAAPLLPEISDFSWDTPEVEKNAERERLCLNGYWAVLPAKELVPPGAQPPSAGQEWGYLKVPYTWGSSRPLNLPKDALTPTKWHTVWYRRTVTVPAERQDSRVFLEIQHIQTHARVFIDNKEGGMIAFPGGRLELTGKLVPGKTHELTILVTAIPQSVQEDVVMDINNIYQKAAVVKNKGIVGDVFLHFVPQTRVENTHFITSVAEKKITFDCALTDLVPGQQYRLEAAVADSAGKVTFQASSAAFTTEALNGGRFRFSAKWSNPALWDIDSPENIYTGTLRLFCGEKVVDSTLPEKFGFREFMITGQNYVLNGKPIHLLAYMPGNYNYSWTSQSASYPLCKMTLKRLKDMGYNFAISENYGFGEGSTSYIRGFFEAADSVGFLHSFSLPHPRAFKDALDTDPEMRAKYRKIADYLITLYWNHPSLVMYATTHNCTGAWGDQNPIRLGKDYQPASALQERKLKEKNRNNALVTQKISGDIDPTRPVYAHSSGGLCGQYTLNMYLNWAPPQERSDWLEYYSTKGEMPLAFVEYGPPHSASFSSCRGWVWNGAFIQTAWDAEYVSAYYGDSIAEWTPERLELLNRIVENNGRPVSFSRYSIIEKFAIVNRLQGDFFADNYRSMRTWNLSMMLPWDYDSNYIALPGSFPAKEWPDRYKKLNGPGLVPDYAGHDKYPLTTYPEAYRLSALGEAIKRWGAPFIAYIGGGKAFTSKEHIYTPGETVEKTLVIINDRRQDQECSYDFFLEGNAGVKESGKLKIPAGGKVFQTVKLVLPTINSNGKYRLVANFQLFDGTTLADKLPVQIIIPDKRTLADNSVALCDPEGKTAEWLQGLGKRFVQVGLDNDLSSFPTVIIGRNALKANGKLPNLSAVRNGQRVLIFEQQIAVLDRLGFRTEELGVRNFFIRDANNPAVAEMAPEFFTNWRGESTLIPPLLDYNDFFCPSRMWCGIKINRVWRCGNRGTVADILIEKPAIGDFMPILDGGFSLQYSPLLEYREGRGKILFCQLNVTARTEREPAAEKIMRNLLCYFDKPVNTEKTNSPSWALIGGNPFRTGIKKLGFAGDVDINAATIVVVGPGADQYPDLLARVEKGAKILCFGLKAAELEKIFPGKIEASDLKAQPSRLADLSAPEFAGINNMDTYFQTKLDYTVTGKGQELAVFRIGMGTVVVCGVSPEMLDEKMFHLRLAFQRRNYLVARLLHNAEIPAQSSLLERFATPPLPEPWKNSYYTLEPVADDNPYRYCHW